MKLHFKFHLLLVSLFISFIGINQVSFSANYSGNCAPVTVTFNNTSAIGDHYNWNFGDGGFANDVVNPTYTFLAAGQYWVDMYAYDVNWNYLGNSFELITIGGGPNSINFSYGVDTHCSNDLINMYVPANGNSFNWDFGDGTSITTGNYAEHSYTTFGQHIVTVNYEDPDCGFITVQDTVYIVNNAPYFASTNPYPGFYISASQVCPGDEVYGSPYGGYSNILWDFGNGNTSSLNSPNWSYLNIGAYQVSVNLTNGCGIDTTLFQTINIDLTTPVLPPSISLPDTICPGETFSFSVYSQGGPEDLLVYM
jgi:PKD repeat protein